MRRLRIVLPIVFVVLCLGALAYVYCAFHDPDDQGLKDFFGEAKVVEDDLRQFYKNRKDYPAYTLDQLQQMGAFDGDARSYWVYFTPFSPKTPEDQIVLRFGCSPFCVIPQFCDISWTKGELTHDPDSDQNPLKDELEDVRLSQAKALAAERPGTRIISTFAWFEPNEPSTRYGELIIDYIQPGEIISHRMHYDLWQKGDTWTVGASKLLR